MPAAPRCRASVALARPRPRSRDRRATRRAGRRARRARGRVRSSHRGRSRPHGPVRARCPIVLTLSASAFCHARYAVGRIFLEAAARSDLAGIELAVAKPEEVEAQALVLGVVVGARVRRRRHDAAGGAVGDDVAELACVELEHLRDGAVDLREILRARRRAARRAARTGGSRCRARCDARPTSHRCRMRAS